MACCPFSRVVSTAEAFSRAMCNLGNSLCDCRERIHRNAHYAIAIRTEIRRSVKRSVRLLEFDGTTVDFGYWFAALWTIARHKDPPRSAQIRMILLIATNLYTRLRNYASLPIARIVLIELPREVRVAQNDRSSWFGGR
jgi:hypothetical protein